MIKKIYIILIAFSFFSCFFHRKFDKVETVVKTDRLKIDKKVRIALSEKSRFLQRDTISLGYNFFSPKYDNVRNSEIDRLL
ncbi:MAG TPA: hypothetical protein PK683_20455, partial [Leptospiraceae bacterium]|nr:hypothetical protein [Leptospiraceae bacterium]